MADRNTTIDVNVLDRGSRSLCRSPSPSAGGFKDLVLMEGHAGTNQMADLTPRQRGLLPRLRRYVERFGP
jgi:hypothetical protein